MRSPLSVVLVWYVTISLSTRMLRSPALGRGIGRGIRRELCPWNRATQDALGKMLGQ